MHRTFKFITRKNPITLARPIRTSPTQSGFANAEYPGQHLKMTKDEGENQANSKSHLSQNKNTVNTSNSGNQMLQKDTHKNEMQNKTDQTAGPKFVDEFVVDPRAQVKQDPPSSIDSTKIPEPEFMKPGEGISTILAKQTNRIEDPRKEQSDHPSTNIMDDSDFKHQPLRAKSSFDSTQDENDQQFNQEGIASPKVDTSNYNQSDPNAFNSTSFNQARDKLMDRNNSSNDQMHQDQGVSANKPNGDRSNRNKIDSGSQKTHVGWNFTETSNNKRNISTEK
jgi:hypothetical protein